MAKENTLDNILQRSNWLTLDLLKMPQSFAKSKGGAERRKIIMAGVAPGYGRGKRANYQSNNLLAVRQGIQLLFSVQGKEEE